ncbi:hypothetical protein DAEQUDRAFT_325768 [Daedalea quercina L-15889]|uniref:F-box domain-containing protein n=1 Tax=Daedalea quercina L-15889 TaxID=1314783 RepID=A0A165PNM2_9APHY|nr:hypothetical protein DAEQUDRAFT_325768 [Daedalea quercina L-15889]
MLYTLQDYERELGGKTTLELSNVLRTKLKLGRLNRTISPEMDAMIHKDLLSTLMLMIDGPNTRVLIHHKLPPEILAVIFNHVRLQPCIRGTPRTSVWDPLIIRLDCLVQLSHVCRYWREIILGTSTLWDRIDDPTRRLKRVDLPAQRAQTVPLVISIAGEPTPSMDALLKGHKPIREVRYDGITISLSQKYLQQQAPLLESLSLTGTSGEPMMGRSRRPSGGYPVQVFRGHTPRLHHLSLDSLHWIPTLQTSALTHLYLADCYGRNLLRRILSLLSASPNLTDLVLVDRNDVLHMEIPQHGAPVHLLRLQRLVFKDMSSAGVKVFLVQVRLTPETCVRIIDVRPLGADLLDKLAELLLRTEVTRFLIKGMGTRFTAVGEGPSAGIVIDHFIAENEEWGTALPRILPIRQLRELHVVLRDSPMLFASTPTAMVDFLARAPALKRLYVDTQGLESLADSLECYGRNSPKLACPGVALHVQMPCHGPRSNLSTIQSFATRQTNLGIRHLVAEYCPGCQGAPYRPWFPRDVQVNFASVTSTPKSRVGHDWRMLRTNWPAC